MARTLNQIYHAKNKVRIAGSGTALKGFSPKAVAEIQKKADQLKGGSRNVAGRSGKSSKLK
jgi:hypothetical protein